MSVGTRLLSTRPVGTGMVVRLCAVLQILHDMTPYFMYENMAYRFCVSDTVRFICFIQLPVFEHPVLHGLWCLLYICVLASGMVTCTWNNASIDNQAQFIDSLPQISPQTLPRHTKKAEAGFRSLRPLAPPHPSPYRKGSGNETNWDILQLHIFIHVGIICHTTTIDPFPLGMG